MNTPTKSGFSLAPNTLKEAMELAELLANSKMIPTDYRGKPNDVLVTMMMGQELGLNPIQALQNIAVINGKPSIYGDALLALMLNHPTFGGIRESFDEATLTASCTVWRKGGDEHTQTFSREDAEKAGLWDTRGTVLYEKNNKKTKNTAPWHCHPRRMLRWRAAGFAIRDRFADALAGLITREEAEDMPVERNITPVTREIGANQNPIEGVAIKTHESASEGVSESTPEMPSALPTYTPDKLNENIAGWRAAIGAKRTSPAHIVGMIESKYVLLDNERKAILAIEPASAAPTDGPTTHHQPQGI